MKEFEIKIYCKEEHIATSIQKQRSQQEAFRALFEMGSEGYERGRNVLYVLEDETVTAIHVEQITHYKISEKRDPQAHVL